MVDGNVSLATPILQLAPPPPVCALLHFDLFLCSHCINESCILIGYCDVLLFRVILAPPPGAPKPRPLVLCSCVCVTELTGKLLYPKGYEYLYLHCFGINAVESSSSCSFRRTCVCVCVCECECVCMCVYVCECV